MHAGNTQHVRLDPDKLLLLSDKIIPYSTMKNGVCYSRKEEAEFLSLILTKEGLFCTVKSQLRQGFTVEIHPVQSDNASQFMKVTHDEPVTITVRAQQNAARGSLYQWKIKIEKNFDFLPDYVDELERLNLKSRSSEVRAKETTETHVVTQSIEDMELIQKRMEEVKNQIALFADKIKVEAQKATGKLDQAKQLLDERDAGLSDIKEKLKSRTESEQAAKEQEERLRKKNEQAARKRAADDLSSARPLSRSRVSFRDEPEVVVVGDSSGDEFTPSEEDGHVFVDQATVKAKCTTLDDAIQFAKEHMGKGYAAVLQAKSGKGYVTQQLVLLGPKANLAMSRNPAEKGAANMQVDGGSYVSTQPIVIKKGKTIKFGSRVQCIFHEDDDEEHILLANHRDKDVESELLPCTIYFAKEKTTDTKYFKVRIVLPDKDTDSAAGATQAMDVHTQEIDGPTQRVGDDGGASDDYDGYAQKIYDGDN